MNEGDMKRKMKNVFVQRLFFLELKRVGAAIALVNEFNLS